MAGVFRGKSDALREFVREYFEDHENEHIAAVVALYERERITLGDAARLADVDRWMMREILRKHGIELRQPTVLPCFLTTSRTNREPR